MTDQPEQDAPVADVDGAAGEQSAAPAEERSETPAGDELAERTADLQRVSAEFANYRRRVDRDRALAGDAGRAEVVAALLPVLDDVERARSHGDLTGAFAGVAEQLAAALTRVGLTAFAAAGDPFDPNQHEAVMHTEAAEVSVPTCVEVYRQGYRLKDRLLRPAMVVVAEPAGAPATGPDEGPGPSGPDGPDGPQQ